MRMIERAAAVAEAVDAWKTRLIVSPTKTPKPLIENALTAFRDAPEWAGVLAYDEFAMTTMAMAPPPWRRLEANSWNPTRWQDVDDIEAAGWLNRSGVGIGAAITAQAIEAVARDESFHPVRDYLDGLRWDGRPRLDAFPVLHLGAEGSAYTRAAARSLFIAAVARIRQPGVKADCMVILEGDQGIGKSRALAALFRPWFTDELSELGSKDASMQLAGVWGVEIAELSAMTRGEIERVKAFVSRTVDRFRPAYGRRVIEVPRQCVLIGTTNADEYLKDESGGRRFLPIRCGRIDLDAIERDRDQIWAEAAVLYETGATWWIVDPVALAAARDEQATRYVSDAWADRIGAYLDGRDEASVADVLERVLDLEPGRWTRADQMRVAACLKASGWRRVRAERNCKRTWVYQKDRTVATGSRRG
jgi:predicted P-loop ATPase